MNVGELERRIDDLAFELAQYDGFRTLWLDPQGAIRHSEPEDELEQLGWVYLVTLERPDRDSLAGALTKLVPIAATPAVVTTWEPSYRPVLEPVLAAARVA